MKRSLALALVSFGLALALAIWRGTPPSPTDGPPSTFSAFRARAVEDAIARPGPRPMGSPNAARARDYLLEKLRSDGYEASVERDFVCGRHGCGFVDNVVGRRGPPGARAVLLAAHYDSVPAGPGASDDGLGVAAISEAARALATTEPGRPILVLFSDGEEAGLLGALAFARRHPNDVFAVINCDARGTTGPSMMFETSGPSGWLVDQFAAAASRPMTSSLFFEVYRRMPNDTDFTVLKTLGPGINLANTTGVTRYHTPLDAIEAADPRTLQHHGEQVLGMARALARAPETLPASESTWFDVLGAFVVRWPSTWTTAFAALGLALVLGQIIRKRAWGLGLAAAPLAAVAAAASAFGLGKVLSLAGAAPVPWVGHPTAALLSLYLASITASATAAYALFRKTRPDVRWAGVWLTWAVLGLAAARIAPGATYLFTVPALAAGLAAFGPLAAASIVPAAVAALLWMPLAVPLYDAVGLFVPAAVCLPAIALGPTLAPLVHEAKRTAALVPATVAAVAALVSTLLPVFTADAPQRTDVIVSRDGERTDVAVSASWGPMAWGPAPRTMLEALGASHPASIVPWGATVDVADWTGQAPRPDASALASRALAPPFATSVDASTAGSKRIVRAHLASARQAGTLVLSWPTERDLQLRFEGVRVQPWGAMAIARAVPPDGLAIEVEAAGAQPIELVVRDVTSGVPDFAANVVLARPATAVPSQEGDITVVVTHLRL